MVVFGVLCFFFYKSYDNTVHLIKKNSYTCMYYIQPVLILEYIATSNKRCQGFRLKISYLQKGFSQDGKISTAFNIEVKFKRKRDNKFLSLNF